MSNLSINCFCNFAAACCSMVLVAGCAGTGLFDPNSLAPDVTGSLPAHAKLDTPEQAISKARELRSLGKFKEASAVLDKAVTRFSESDVVRLERGLQNLETGNAKAAAADLEKVAKGAPENWRAHSGLGAALAALGDYEQAETALSKALSVSPDNPRVLNNLAMLRIMSGRSREAGKLLERARKVASKDADASKIDQNLAIVAGLEGRKEAVRKLASKRLPEGDVANNIAVLERLRNSRPVSRPATRRSLPEGRRVAASEHGEPPAN